MVGVCRGGDEASKRPVPPFAARGGRKDGPPKIVLSAIVPATRLTHARREGIEVDMPNRYGISEEDEEEIRARDKRCVYCHVLLKHYPHAMSASGATIEHFNNDGPFDKKYNVGFCCRRCNSSKGTQKLSAWFGTAYCKNRKKEINARTVAKPVKEYIRLTKRTQPQRKPAQIGPTLSQTAPFMSQGKRKDGPPKVFFGI